MTWLELSREQREAARTLLRGRSPLPRAAASRAYYAAYAIVVHRMRPGFALPRDRRNPSHEQLPEILRQTPGVSRGVGLAVRRLRLTREIADYKPHIDLTLAEAKTRLADLEFVSRELGNAGDGR